MNQEIKKQWQEALRSGLYRQGQGGLRDKHDNYCCLGVLCDLHAKATKNAWIPSVTHQVYMNRGGTLPSEVVVWADLEDNDPKINGIRLSFYNDGLDKNRNNVPYKDFNEIADLLEQL